MCLAISLIKLSPVCGPSETLSGLEALGRETQEAGAQIKDRGPVECSWGANKTKIGA